MESKPCCALSAHGAIHDHPMRRDKPLPASVLCQCQHSFGEHVFMYSMKAANEWQDRYRCTLAGCHCGTQYRFAVEAAPADQTEEQRVAAEARLRRRIGL
jgi:hypothetical protein